MKKKIITMKKKIFFPKKSKFFKKVLKKNKFTCIQFAFQKKPNSLFVVGTA